MGSDKIRSDELAIDPRWGIRADPLMVQQLELAEEDFVTGEKFDQRSDGSFLRLYPSIDRVAVKYGIPLKILSDIAVRNAWEEQRRRFHEHVRAEIRAHQAKVRAVSHQEMLDGVDRSIRKFLEKADAGKVVMDTVQDFERAVRLREFLLGNSESKKELKVAISLEEMQARHRAALQEANKTTDEVAGLLTDDSGEVPDGEGLDGVVVDAEV